MSPGPIHTKDRRRAIEEQLRPRQFDVHPEPPALKWVLLVALIGLVFLLGFSVGQATAEPCIVSITIDPPQARIQQPHSVNDYAVRVRVNRHPEHRLLVLSWDGGRAGAGSSRRALDGTYAEEVHTFKIRGQQASTWTYVAAVYDARGKRISRVTLDTLLAGEPD